MSLLERIGLPLLKSFPPETAHGLSIKALNMGLAGGRGPVTSPRLRTSVAGIEMANPVGLAAGFDKNAQAVRPLSKVGFGFLEVGAATPRAQPGNPKPRLFRLDEDQAAINRFGFNNDGMHAIADRLDGARATIPVGLNLGANKDSADRAADFATVLERAGDVVDFATVNVSSPNTERLRDLQGKAALLDLLDRVISVRNAHARGTPIFLKIAPDLSGDELAEIVEVAAHTKINGIIATNTTLSRDGLQSPHKGEAGGLSGQPVFEASTRVLAQLSKLTDGKLPLIGVGGVSNAEQAYAKIKAGASAVQLYTAMVYAGVSLAADIAKGLDALLERDGHASLQDAVGTGRDAWL
ncbi:quinone-dependent dihydroorotate dehydrogenase [uncultured Litoreibacter sp.]|uniref:quinone-dependent dihydroorotate dehydrogenase n=1 Tax=uncultured Litoreibacter sp. TaxID=1392394 RepID=UPI002603A4C3|nr:quinone-dependent dihydroorotate dehydrogenase [uncultured Litoreibacter sp.]